MFMKKRKQSPAQPFVFWGIVILFLVVGLTYQKDISSGLLAQLGGGGSGNEEGCLDQFNEGYENLLREFNSCNSRPDNNKSDNNEWRGRGFRSQRRAFPDR